MKFLIYKDVKWNFWIIINVQLFGKMITYIKYTHNCKTNSFHSESNKIKINLNIYIF